MRIAIVAVLAGAALASQQPFLAPTSGASSVPIDISAHYNDKGTSGDGRNDGNGLKNGSTFPTEHLPTGRWVNDGVTFAFPDNWDALTHDNVRADGHVLRLGRAAELASLHLVCTGEDPGGFNRGETKETLRLGFSDNTEASVDFEVKNWWNHHWTNKGQIRSPFQWNADGERVYNASHLFHVSVSLPTSTAGREVRTITLPLANDWNAVHVFAVSYVPVSRAEHPKLEDKVRPAVVRATRRWRDIGSARAQVVEVAVRNPLSSARHGDMDAWVAEPIDVTLRGAGFETVDTPRVARLMPGDEFVVEVGVVPTDPEGDFDDVSVHFSSSEGDWSVPVHVEGARLVHDFTRWSPDEDDVEQHSAPQWYDGAKFGIFVHWGLYAVPAWSDNTRYSEWYDFWLHDDDVGGTVYEHHKDAWGEDFVYDDFIPLFTADKFNASEWVQLFADAGAGYFVFTTKHHDGYALFDTGNTSNRNSLKYGPQRDFLRELMDAAEKEQPHLKRGTYFSMPEWFNPLYAPHGRVSFPGGPARNPYTREEEPYTGFVDVDDYVSGIQVPQMRILADEYKTDLVWCDIGLDNGSAEFVAEWYGHAAAEGRQVAIDNRCGIGGDFDTPEMTKFSTVQKHKWESCASMDPYSFGYSAATRDDEYRNASDVVHTLVDIVAKGGNFLLNVGPKADGSIIPAMSEPLREAGRWLRTNGRAIYNTTTFPLVPEVQTPDAHVEITRTDTALYLISLRDLDTTLRIPAPLPVLACDDIVLVTERGDVHVPFTYDEGVLSLDLRNTSAHDRTGHIAYVFEVSYRECGARTRDEL